MEYHDKMTRHAPPGLGDATTLHRERPDPFLELNPLFHHRTSSERKPENRNHDAASGHTDGHGKVDQKGGAKQKIMHIRIPLEKAQNPFIPERLIMKMKPTPYDHRGLG